MRIVNWFNSMIDKLFSDSNEAGFRIALSVMTRFSEILPSQLEVFVEMFNPKPVIPCAVCVIYNRRSKLILAVHRKDDSNDWGLPGGKLENEEVPMVGMIRELEEETCYTVVNSNYVTDLGIRDDNGTPVHTFVVEMKGIALHTGSCEQNYAWVKPELLCKGSFGDFNTKLFEDIRNEM